MDRYSRQHILAFFTFIALIAILAVQLNWLFNAARLEEERFNYFVNKALTEAKNEVGDLASECINMNDFLCGNANNENINNKNVAKIDSILRSKLDKYNIELDYTFAVAELDAPDKGKGIFKNRCYLKCLNGILEKEGIKIMLEFPGRNQFILAQLTGTFMLAFGSILFVMISFFFTSRMFRKERLMLQQTTDFINNMVHEFQTPLANIRLASNLIKKKEKSISDPKIPGYVDVIITENRKLEKNVEEI
jgi:two-component system phosphate regulon sensor histidine kinase PhoR